ncbi:MAG: LysR substrate-binding domain-containing protein, partial [Pseudomonadota bacterium]
RLGLTRKNASIEFQRLAGIKLLTTEGVDGLGALIREVEAQQGIKLDTRPTLGQLMSDLRVIMDGEAAMILPWSAVHHLAEDPSLSVATISSPRLERRIDLISRDAFRNALAERRVAEVIGALVPHLLAKRLVKGRSLWQTSAGAHLSSE